jgi:hypothetical protein
MGSENQQTTDYSYSKVPSRIRTLSSEIDRSPTTRGADEDERLPGLDTIYRIADKGWNGILEDADAGTTQIERYTDDERSHVVRDLQRVFSLRPTEELTSRECREKGSYAASTIKKHFGSWAEACEEANIACGSRHGNSCPGPKGESLDSRHEQRIAFSSTLPKSTTRFTNRFRGLTGSPTSICRMRRSGQK